VANIFNKLFKPKKVNTNFNDVLKMSGYEPNFSKFGSDTLYSNVVYSAVQMKCRYFGKLEPRHVNNKDGKLTVISDSNIAKVLRNPNHYQTTYDFLAQAYFMRRKDKTCYILADVYNDANTLTGLYVLLPSDKPILNEKENGDLEYLFSFDGVNHLVPFDYDTVIVWRDNIEDQQYIGGGKYSTQAQADLLSSLSAYHDIKQAVAEAAKLGCMFDGLLKVNAYGGDDEATKAIRDKFLEDIRTNANGLPVLDNGADYIQVQRQLKMVDGATLQEIKEDALISEGVNIDFLMGKMTTQDKEAFFETHIEPAAVSLGQAMSKILFSQWQTSHGDQIILYPHKVQLMATSEIVSIIQSTISAGVFKIDEYREMLGYAPLDNGEGQQRPRGFNNLDGNENVGGATE
jgi:HK97 family phage portal protein